MLAAPWGGPSLPDVSFGNLLLVTAVAFAAPFTLGLFPALRLPAVVVEILAGIVLGPSLMGWLRVDLPVQILSLIGLAFLLFLAGMEISFERLRGRILKLTGLAFLVSIGLALISGSGIGALGLVGSPLLLAIILLATSLGLVIPVLKDAGETNSTFGQLVISGASVGDFGAVLLLALFFSRQASSTASTVILLAGFGLVAALVVITLRRAGRVMRLTGLLLRLQDTTAEIRVRGAVLLLIGFVALARWLGLETILAAFLAGAGLRLVDRDQAMTHPNFRLKLEAMGFGFFIPVFFVASGVQFNLGALFSSGATAVRIPLFLLALLLVRGIPAALYRGVIGDRPALAAGLLQATSLPFIVAATQIGIQRNLITAATGAALVAAGLLSVMIFPAAALGLLQGGKPAGRGR